MPRETTHVGFSVPTEMDGSGWVPVQRLIELMSSAPTTEEVEAVVTRCDWAARAACRAAGVRSPTAPASVWLQ